MLSRLAPSSGHVLGERRHGVRKGTWVQTECATQHGEVGPFKKDTRQHALVTDGCFEAPAMAGDAAVFRPTEGVCEQDLLRTLQPTSPSAKSGFRPGAYAARSCSRVADSVETLCRSRIRTVPAGTRRRAHRRSIARAPAFGLVWFGEMKWEKAGMEEFGGRQERAAGVPVRCLVSIGGVQSSTYGRPDSPRSSPPMVLLKPPSPLSSIVLLALVGCGPLVEVDGQAGDAQGVVEDPGSFTERDDAAFRALTERCGCSQEIYVDYDWRLEYLENELDRMALGLDVACGDAVLDVLESPGCGLDEELPNCRVFLGDRQENESCTQGVWLDDCGPSLFCLANSSSYPAQGTCRPQAPLGQPCEDRAHTCAEGVCLDRTCVLEAMEPGDACWRRCGSGLMCEDGICREQDKCDVIPGIHR